LGFGAWDLRFPAKPVKEDTVMAMKFEKKGEGAYLLDCQGYVCPHPQLYTKKAMENPSSSESISAMADAAGHEIVEQQQVNGKFTWKIRKAA
jgi:tRNA 2-thiouridine synthesizing protein A